MAEYVVESYGFTIEHGGRTSQGAIGVHKGSEKIYLHVVSLSDAEVAQLAPRVDEAGNVEHARLALPRNEEFWVAVEGEVGWPKVHAPRIVSTCDLSGKKPKPVPLSDDDRGRLRKAGVAL